MATSIPSAPTTSSKIKPVAWIRRLGGCARSRRQTHTHIFRRWSMREPSRTSESALSVIFPQALGMLKRHGKLQAYTLFVRERERARGWVKSNWQAEWMWCESKNNSPQIYRSTVRCITVGWLNGSSFSLGAGLLNETVSECIFCVILGNKIRQRQLILGLVSRIWICLWR